MIVKTVNSLYEVRDDEKRFRQLGDPKDAAWHDYERMGPVLLHEPLRFFSLTGARGSSATMSVWATAPVEGVVHDDGTREPRRQGRLAS